MYRYIVAGLYGPEIDEEKQVATIYELLALCKSGDVARVIIPSTYYGYGETLVDESNRRSIKRHYPRARFKEYKYSLTMSASQFIRNAEYRDMVMGLEEEYAVFDESDHSELEYDTQFEEVLNLLDRETPGDDFPELTREEIEAVMTWRGEAPDYESFDFSDYVEFDLDGTTVYIHENNYELLKQRFVEVWAIAEFGVTEISR